MPETLTNFDQAVEHLVEELIRLTDSVTPQPVLLIDGRAGAGKSTLANAITDRYFKLGESKPALVHLDDLYPGWSGLQAGVMYALHNILQPVAAGKSGAWQVWDWARGERGRLDEPGNGWREFRGGTPLIVEGCGAINRQTSQLADITIWLEAPEPLRRQRWQQRDGNRFDEYWSIWAAQEDEVLTAERPELLADLVLNVEPAAG